VPAVEDNEDAGFGGSDVLDGMSKSLRNEGDIDLSQGLLTPTLPGNRKESPGNLS